MKLSEAMGEQLPQRMQRRRSANAAQQALPASATPERASQVVEKYTTVKMARDEQRGAARLTAAEDAVLSFLLPQAGYGGVRPDEHALERAIENARSARIRSERYGMWVTVAACAMALAAETHVEGTAYTEEEHLAA